MVNPNVHFNGGFLPDILLLTQAPKVVSFDDIIIVLRILLHLFNYVMYCLLFLMYLVARHSD